MRNTLPRGFKLLEEKRGSGHIAATEDHVTIRHKMTLNQGNCVAEYKKYSFTTGRRQVIAAIEQSVASMKIGCQRVVKASPHLAYRETGVEGYIQKNAVSALNISLIDVIPKPLK